MVKPVFKALNGIKAADTAQQAYQIALDFLKSADAQKVDDARAGTFAQELETVFARHSAPVLFEALLLKATSQESSVSFGLRTSLGFKLTDLRLTSEYAMKAPQVLQANAQILSGVANTENAPAFKDADYHMEGSEDGYPEIQTARTPQSLNAAILNTLMTEPDVSDEKAQEFMKALSVAFRRVGATPNEQIDMLNMIADTSSAEDSLYELVVRRASDLITEDEGSPPRTAHTGGREPTMP